MPRAANVRSLARRPIAMLLLAVLASGGMSAAGADDRPTGGQAAPPPAAEAPTGTGTGTAAADGVSAGAAHPTGARPGPAGSEPPPSQAEEGAAGTQTTTGETDAAGPGGDGGGAPVTPLAAMLPRDLSPWGMFMAADSVVKAVMVGLAIASLVTWTVALAKGAELALAGRRYALARAILGRTRSLADAQSAIGGRRGAAPTLVAAAALEAELSAGLPAEGVKERVASRLERIEAATARALRRGTGVLATIGATAPFVGLFGTVWGIMNAFIGISEAQTTNLAVVAPGIAEALLATALGLVAAIPAVVIYNHFARRVADLRLALADVSAEVLRLASRDLDRRASRRLAAAAE
jgi:biopolymer transport protein ExbB